MEVEYHEEYVRNSRGVQLFTCGWLPAAASPKALVFLCHGYGMECSGFMRELEEYRSKSRFLYGESMGGAVALLLHRARPHFWTGAVLVAPMCKISEKVKPHPLVITLLTRVEDVIPKWKIVPTKDIIDAAFKDPIKREKIRKNKLIYQDKPRLKTALEMLRTSMYIEDSLSQVKLPFFILHGEADTVTDPEISRALYERAASEDKTIKLYPGMWHGLTAGEPDENVEAVFSDIVAWLNERSRGWTMEDHLRKLMPVMDGENGGEAPAPGKVMDGENGGEAPVVHARAQRQRRGFLCGLAGRTHHHAEM
ncbi:Caffeoylshikimate esterase [Dichanthelium oligosanthes]|uniref:Caffeoylshikimate esterase n=1 Tax=Dichanthelium oligosanthes TaxID=888268 RepID=A0A1E5V4U9_9POAL|nr:Caffeoylshikimate esterase [Dichanthelium oligosanthes]